VLSGRWKQAYPHAWTKAGVMVRESIAANAKQVDMIVFDDVALRQP
jgi:hypothetical protein